MSRISIACIVEGHGDVKAVPVLVRRIVHEIDPAVTLAIPEPAIRVSRSSLVKPGELERAVTLAASKNAVSGGMLVLVDADDDCPAALGPHLLARAQAVRTDTPIAVVLANPEYEAWFLASAVALRGKQGLAETLEPPADPESVRGAKEWLRERMLGSRTYRETIDQLALTRFLDVQAARQADSFDKLYRSLVLLTAQLRAV